MIRSFFTFLFPKQKLPPPPKHVTSEWARGNLDDDIALILMARLARDPHEARQVLDELKEEYGDDVWHHISLLLKKPRTETWRERFCKLLRRMAGELERPKPWYRHRDPVVNFSVKWTDDD
jgi:anti-sigma factor RsiW